MAESGSQQKIEAEKLCLLTGLTDRRHRQLAEQGWFPAPRDSEYLLVPTLQGMFRYYREAGQREKKNLVELKAGKLERENKKLDLEIAVTEKKMIAVKEVDALLLHIATLQKTILYQALEREMPAKGAGRSAGELTALGRGLADRLCEIFAEEETKWKWE